MLRSLRNRCTELKNVAIYWEESSRKLNEFREPIFGINVTFQTGNTAYDLEDTYSPELNICEPVKFNEVNTNAVLPSADDSQDRVTASLLSSRIPSGISYLGGHLFNALVNLDLCMESDDESNTIQQMEVAAESFFQTSSNGEEQMDLDLYVNSLHHLVCQTCNPLKKLVIIGPWTS